MPADAKYLRDFSCFQKLTQDQVKTLAQITNAVCYPAGYVLFEEGKPGERLFFLVKGDIEVMYQIGETGQVKVDAVTAEEVVGCSALIEPYVYTATERSLTAVEVLEVDAVALRELMQKDCQMGLSIQRHIIGVLLERVLDLRLAAA